MSAAVPAELLASIDSVNVWGPAESAIPDLVTVVQMFQPPVSGSAHAPVMLVPSTERWTVPPEPLASIDSFSTCCPADNTTSLFVTVCHVLHPPVSGSDTAPVTFAPSIERCTVPPDPSDATRKSSE